MPAAGHSGGHGCTLSHVLADRLQPQGSQPARRGEVCVCGDSQQRSALLHRSVQYMQNKRGDGWACGFALRVRPGTAGRSRSTTPSLSAACLQPYWYRVARRAGRAYAAAPPLRHTLRSMRASAAGLRAPPRGARMAGCCRLGGISSSGGGPSGDESGSSQLTLLAAGAPCMGDGEHAAAKGRQ